ncbi:MAG: glycoside hydrolase domain-containing protein [Gemmatimonadaceae bacterium]
MLLHGHVFTAPTGIRGFDANASIEPSVAAAFHDHGYRFCVRYVRRADAHPFDLTADEATCLLDAGLGVMMVQHVESETAWSPTGEKGTANGQTAAHEADKIGVPAGVTLWCDLEGVAPGTSSQDVTDYCNQWHTAVASSGYVPGLYVGFHSGLNPTQLYRSLRFTHYWGAYNLNSDESPAVRGLQMKQAAAKPVDTFSGTKPQFQVDRVRADALGGAPTLLAPDGWLEQL